MMELSALRKLQQQLAQQVMLTDQLDNPQPGIIGGADVGFIDGGALTRGVVVLLEFPSLTLLEYQIACIETTMPYRSGFLAFREYPALAQALRQLSGKPDLLLVDGQGIAHPAGLGLASYVGVKENIPTIGVAKSRLFGDFIAPDAIAGSKQALVTKGKQIGWVWRSKQRCNPLFISPGHRVSLAASLSWVQRCMKGYRLPEPTRLADAIASDRQKNPSKG